MGMEAKQYRSSTRKLVKFFERSRDQWKQKCLGAILRFAHHRMRTIFFQQSSQPISRRRLVVDDQYFHVTTSSQGNCSCTR